MDREQYLEMRKNNNISLDIFYKYYIENTSRIMDYITFQQLFPLFFNQNSNMILEYLDKKFNITTLLNKQGNGIAVF